MHDKSMKSELGVAMLGKVREYASKLPETEEKIDGFGHMVLRVRDKSFVFMGEGENGGDPGMSIKTDKETQQLLIGQGHFYKTPYIGQHGWVSIKADQIRDWEEIAQLIEEAYLRTAPKKLVQAYKSRNEH
ncbi:phosphoribosylglycinamide formyltransferase [Cohnella kolymensis]|uniref:Phosphoribosylglycinamide formyltransferase n=1 Tax=Cohnella kolymensis TaxID=1590652 RepID=A0ABR5A3N5_9BACL|nr:MmcQ/YjbR family DNA-binding protein [Cohnella kolymensis]KIL35656.1 phosphoribosylglycinamide formyltransferase [Cohnella kolymensis]